MRRKRSIFIHSSLIVSALILWGTTFVWAAEPIYGPKKFTRATGKPAVVIETFSAPNAAAHYRLIVLNGENGRNRVSSATVKINGTEILRERDFNQQVDRIERSVSLSALNSISVELKSAPGSFIIITIECLDCSVITNHPPVAQDQSATTDEDIAKPITLVATDSNGDALTYQIVAQPTHGTLSGTSSDLMYTPAAGYYGSDSFTFKANDGKLDSNLATVSITVTRVNHPPVAQDQSVTTDQDTVKPVTLVATDQDGDALTYQIAAQPAHGALSGTPPNLTYTPASHFYGSDGFTFKANDGELDSNIAAVSITVTQVNHPPLAQNQSVTTDQDIAKAINLVATDPDGDSLTYQIVTQPVHGTLSGTPPILTYTPAIGYSGSDSFTFKADDAKLESNTATVSIVIRINHLPVAQNQCVTTDQGTAKAISLSATDIDNDPLTYTIVAQPAHGTLSGTLPYVTYIPSDQYFGRDSFTFKVNDGNADSNIAMASISVSQMLGIGVITTVAGNGDISYGGDGGIATKARLLSPSGVAVDAEGNLFVADRGNNRIRRLDKNGIITTIAGSASLWGGGGYSGDGGPAVQAELRSPEDVAIDSSGNLYIAEYANDAIRRVSPNGIITTVAGGRWGRGGDGGPATEAGLNGPSGVAGDNLGNLYIADQWNHRIRKVDKDGIITTLAGNGSEGYSGDGGPAAQAQLHGPTSIAVDTAGNIYIADWGNNRVRKVDVNGIISTFAGNGIAGFSGDGGAAAQAQLQAPAGVALDASGNVYIAEYWNHRIRKVDLYGTITTVAGNGISGDSGDGGPATEARLGAPRGATVDASGTLYIADLGNNKIRKVVTGGIITTVAGSEKFGDGGLATEANLIMPTGATIDACGNLYIADNYLHRVRKVDVDGIITTVAGNGDRGYSGDGGLATEAQLYYPEGMVVDNLGNLYIADSSNHRVRKVDPDGVISTFAGNGVGGYSGDGGPATQAELNHPSDVAADASGNIYIADFYNNRLRKVNASGIITTIVGGALGFGGDGGPAAEALIAYPSGVALDASGNIYIADHSNDRIRKVDTNGIITTVAGNGTSWYGGDGGPATEAALQLPLKVAVDSSGNLYIADYYNDLIRKVDTTGIITTIAGGGEPPYPGLEFWGDGGPATKAVLCLPQGVAVDASDNLYIADTDNNRIRKVPGASKSAAVVGKVTDFSTGLPLSQVTVSIEDSANTFQTKTGSNGMYVVSGLIPGGFAATFEMPGYIEQTVNGTSIAGRTQTLDVQLVPAPPQLIFTITSPSNGAILTSSPIWVIGNVSNSANVTVNGVLASVQDNTFFASIPVNEGINTITATAADQYGQTASQSISVTLNTGPTVGSITGTVTDSSTGLPVPSATVSVKDSTMIAHSQIHLAFIGGPKATLTDSNGKYTINGIFPGAFTGSISKDGYATYNFSGTMTAGETVTIDAALNRLLPVISNISVSAITANSATITWTTDQLSDSFIEYGMTTSYGSSASDATLTASHTITLSNLISGTTYHFKATSTNSYGFSSSSGDLTFKISSPLISLTITFPSDGGSISVRDTIIEGTIMHARGSETGVVVNGMLANIYGNEFVVNHVPLVEGPNAITATATDIDGNTDTVSITVNAGTPANYIRITSNAESGLLPLDSILKLESSLDLTNASLTYAGPAPVEFLSTSASEYRVRMTAEGIYYFTATITDSSGNPYSGTVAITVLPEAYIDGLLRGKWEAMRAKLASGDIEGALVSFDESTKQDYRDLFGVLSTILPTVAQDMSDIKLVEYLGNAAIYDIRTTRDGVEYSFQLLFGKDLSGIWRIISF